MFSGITEDDTQKLIALYQKTEAKIIEDLKNVDIVNRVQKEASLRMVQNELEKLNAPTKEFLDMHVENEYKAGVKIVNESLGVSFALINKEAIESLVSSAYDEIRLALGASVTNTELLMNRLTREARQEVLEATGRALITGQARKDLSKEFYKILKADGITGYRYTDKNGKVYNVKLETYVDTTARNALRDAQNESVASSSLKAGVDLVKFSTHSNPSPMCKPWQGKVVSITGTTDGYATLEEARTWYKGIGICNHRYCRHRYVPYNNSDVPFVVWNSEKQKYEQKKL